MGAAGTAGVGVTCMGTDALATEAGVAATDAKAGAGGVGWEL